MSIEDERQAQEDLENSINGGYYKTMVKGQKTFFDEYLRVGFTREEALKLTISVTTKSSG